MRGRMSESYSGLTIDTNAIIMNVWIAAFIITSDWKCLAISATNLALAVAKAFPNTHNNAVS